MNVIAFPRPDASRHHVRLIVLLTCALQIIGKPATIEELVELVGFTPNPTDDILETLISALTDQNEGQFPLPLFETVMFEGREAWACTREYRRLMYERGIFPFELRA